MYHLDMKTDGMQITSGAKGKMVVHSNGEIKSTRCSTIAGHGFRKKKKSYLLIEMN